MSSYTTTTIFTRTNAHYIATKIAADLRQMSLFYPRPYAGEIEDYLVEITEHLAAGYLASFEAGYKITSTNTRVVTVRYEVREDNTLADDNSGRVYPGADVSGAGWFSYLITNGKFARLSAAEQHAFNDRMPIARTAANEPGDGDGYWTSDKSYASGGWGTARQTFRAH
jgi:hypothetical protein